MQHLVAIAGNLRCDHPGGCAPVGTALKSRLEFLSLREWHKKMPFYAGLDSHETYIDTGISGEYQLQETSSSQFILI